MRPEVSPLSYFSKVKGILRTSATNSPSSVKRKLKASRAEVVAVRKPRFAQADTAIVFDWDDTIFPSSWMDSIGLIQDLYDNEKIDSHMLFEIQQVCGAAAAVLENAATLGNVLIITNAEEGWVELSARWCMPQLIPLFESKRVRVISARTSYESLYPGSRVAWKAAAFGKELCETLGCDETSMNSMKNIISIGDSTEERTAAFIVGSQRTARVKSIKLVENPHPRQCVKQLTYLTEQLEQICNHDGNMDIALRCASFSLTKDGSCPSAVEFVKYNQYAAINEERPVEQALQP